MTPWVARSIPHTLGKPAHGSRQRIGVRTTTPRSKASASRAAGECHPPSSRSRRRSGLKGRFVATGLRLTDRHVGGGAVDGDGDDSRSRPDRPSRLHPLPSSSDAGARCLRDRGFRGEPDRRQRDRVRSRPDRHRQGQLGSARHRDRRGRACSCCRRSNGERLGRSVARPRPVTPRCRSVCGRSCGRRRSPDRVGEPAWLREVASSPQERAAQRLAMARLDLWRRLWPAGCLLPGGDCCDPQGRSVPPSRWLRCWSSTLSRSRSPRSRS